MLVKFLFYLLRGKNLIPNLKTKYCRCCCVGWMELGQLWQLLHVKNGVKHFLIIFCFAVGIGIYHKKLIMWNNTDKWMEMQAITHPKILGAIALSYPPYCYWWLIMKKRGWKLYRSPNPNPRGVRKCNSAKYSRWR